MIHEVGYLLTEPNLSLRHPSTGHHHMHDLLSAGSHQLYHRGEKKQMVVGKEYKKLNFHFLVVDTDQGIYKMCL
jgi:hypothetical protein